MTAPSGRALEERQGGRTDDASLMEISRRIAKLGKTHPSSPTMPSMSMQPPHHQQGNHDLILVRRIHRGIPLGRRHRLCAATVLLGPKIHPLLGDQYMRQNGTLRTIKTICLLLESFRIRARLLRAKVLAIPTPAMRVGSMELQA